MLKKLEGKGAFIIVFVGIMWSIDGLLRVVLYSLPPTVIVFWEHIIGAVILSPFIFKYRKEFAKMTRKEWIAILFVSLFSGALGTMAYTAALQTVQFAEFSVVPLLQQLQPIWAISFAAIILKERLNRRFVTWAGLAITASYLITFRDLTVATSSGQMMLTAGGLAVVAGAMWGTSTSFSKIVLNKVHFLTAAVMRFWVTSLITLPIVFAFGHQGSLLSVTQDQFAKLLMITFSTGMLSLVLYYYGLRKVPARVSTIAELSFPASAIVIQYIFGKPFSITQIAGIGLLLIAIYKVSRYRE